MSDTTTAPKVQDPQLDDGDHDRFSHYARKEDVTRSYVTGTPLTALCGKTWVPTRDPSNYPLCPSCKEQAARIAMRGDN